MALFQPSIVLLIRISGRVQILAMILFIFQDTYERGFSI